MALAEVLKPASCEVQQTLHRRTSPQHPASFPLSGQLGQKQLRLTNQVRYQKSGDKHRSHHSSAVGSTVPSPSIRELPGRRTQYLHTGSRPTSEGTGAQHSLRISREHNTADSRFIQPGSASISSSPSYSRANIHNTEREECKRADQSELQNSYNLRPELKNIHIEKLKDGDDSEYEDSGFHEDDSTSSSDEHTSPERTHSKTTPTSLPVTHDSLNPSLSKRQLKRQRRRARKREEESLFIQTQVAIKDKLREENERLKQQLYCRVCMDAPVGAMLLPCRHSVLCWSCSQRLRDCPVCRAKTATRVSIYLACS